jgi:hypothetical protein
MKAARILVHIEDTYDVGMVQTFHRFNLLLELQGLALVRFLFVLFDSLYSSANACFFVDTDTHLAIATFANLFSEVEEISNPGVFLDYKSAWTYQ